MKIGFTLALLASAAAAAATSDFNCWNGYVDGRRDNNTTTRVCAAKVEANTCDSYPDSSRTDSVLAGSCNNERSKVVTVDAIHPKSASGEVCKLDRIMSCNHRFDHTANWCYARLEFSNCAEIQIMDKKCADYRYRGKCDCLPVNGPVKKLSMYTDAWNRNAAIETPAGFAIETTELQSQVNFGGNPTEKPELVRRVNSFDASKYGYIVGVSYDNTSYADFLSFRLTTAGTVSEPRAENKNKAAESSTTCDAGANPPNGGFGSCDSALASGSSCFISCDKGYEARGSTSCNNGTLTRATCVKTGQILKTCDATATVSNGTIGDCTRELKSGTTCQPTCNAGFTVSGASQCRDGTLIGATCSKTTLTDCQTKAPTNGAVGNCSASLTSGQSCQPTCATGYAVSGSATCNNTVFTNATCSKTNASCAAIKAPANGAVGDCGTSQTSGSSCSPTCNTGYSVSGKASCKDGIFTPATCAQTFCNASAIPLNGASAGDCTSQLLSGKTCTPVCQKRYKVSGASTCQDAKYTPATCVSQTLATCDASIPIANGSVGDCTDKLASGASCQPFCNNGWKVSGTSSCKDGVLTPATCWQPETMKYPAQPTACPAGDLPANSQELPGMAALMNSVNAISGDATKRAKLSKVFCNMTYTKKKLVKEYEQPKGRRLATGDSCNDITAPTNQQSAGDCGTTLTSGTECTPVCVTGFTLNSKSTCLDGVFTQGICTNTSASSQTKFYAVPDQLVNSPILNRQCLAQPTSGYTISRTSTIQALMQRSSAIGSKLYTERGGIKWGDDDKDTQDEAKMTAVLMYGGSEANVRKNKHCHEFTAQKAAKLYDADIKPDAMSLDPSFTKAFKAIDSEKKAYQVAYEYGTHYIKNANFGATKSASYQFPMTTAAAEREINKRAIQSDLTKYLKPKKDVTIDSVTKITNWSDPTVRGGLKKMETCLLDATKEDAVITMEHLHPLVDLFESKEDSQKAIGFWKAFTSKIIQAQKMCSNANCSKSQGQCAPKFSMWLGGGTSDVAANRDYDNFASFFDSQNCICEEGFEGDNCEKQTNALPLVAVYDARTTPLKYKNVWNTGATVTDPNDQVALFSVTVAQSEYSGGGAIEANLIRDNGQQINNKFPAKRPYWLYEENENRDQVLKVPDDFEEIWKANIAATTTKSASEIVIYKPKCPTDYVPLGTYPMEGAKDTPYVVYVLNLKNKARCIKQEYTKLVTSWESIFKKVKDQDDLLVLRANGVFDRCKRCTQAQVNPIWAINPASPDAVNPKIYVLDWNKVRVAFVEDEA